MRCYTWQNTNVIVEKILSLAESVRQRYNCDLLGLVSLNDVVLPNAERN